MTIYELFSGVAPFGLHGSQDDIYARRQNMQFRPLAALAPETAPVLSLLVGGMLEFLPENRPDYEEIAAILDAVISQSPLESSAQ